MPTRTYMGVDVRRDHGFRVPRPDLAVQLGTSDACTACHSDRDAAWAAEALRRFGSARDGEPHFGSALLAGRQHRPGAREALTGVIDDASMPAIVRATALAELGAVGAAGSEGSVSRALRDPDPLVRMAAADACASIDARTCLGWSAPLLRDPVRAVRLEAERVLRTLPPPLWSPADRSALAAVQDEFQAVQRLNADRPESWVNLGNLSAARGDLEQARQDTERALAIEPDFVAALVNLADLDRQRGRDDEGEKWLLRAAQAAPDNADVQHALGLLWVRQGRRDDAVRALARAAILAPDQPRYALVHALALESVGRAGEAVVALEAAAERFPDDPEILFTLAGWARDRGDWDDATAWARRLVGVLHGEPGAQQLLATIEADARRARSESAAPGGQDPSGASLRR